MKNKLSVLLLTTILLFVSFINPILVIAETMSNEELWQKVWDESDAGDTNLQDHTRRARHFLSEKFGIAEAGGYRPDDDGNGTGHGAGLAVDFMVDALGGSGDPQGKGKSLSEFASQNIEELQIEYIIWEQKIYFNKPNIYGEPNKWHLMPDRGSPTQNHMDHVHISFRVGGQNSKDVKFSGNGSTNQKVEGVPKNYDASGNTGVVHGPLPKESELVGMPKRENQLKDYQTPIEFPGVEDLAATHQHNASALEDSITVDKKGVIHYLRVFTTYAGIIIAIYGTIILVAYVFDRNNIWIEISAIAVVTLGRYKFDDSDLSKEELDYYPMGMREMFKVVLLTEIIGLLLYSGIIYIFIEIVIHLISSIITK